MKASSLIETIVASIIFMTIFSLTLQTVTLVATRKSEGTELMVLDNGMRNGRDTISSVVQYRDYNDLSVVVTVVKDEDMVLVDKRIVVNE